MDTNQIQKEAQDIRLKQFQAEQERQDIRKRDITIRSDYRRTLNYSWSDSTKMTSILLGLEYDLTIEEINRILKS